MSDAAYRAELAEAARGYHGQGLSLLPIKFDASGRKVAAVHWKARQEDRADLCTVRREIQTLDNVDGIACILGSASCGLWCRDFDSVQAYQNWSAKHPPAAQSLPTVKTHSGYHVYAKSSGDVGFKDFGGSDGELRGDRKHYMVLPPSRHPRGGRYEWVVPLPVNFEEVPRYEPGELGLWQPWLSATGVADDSAQGGTETCIDGQRLTETPVPPLTSSVRLCTPQEVVQKCRVHGPGESDGRVLDLFRGLKFNCRLTLADAMPHLEHWFEQNKRMMSGDHDLDDFTYHAQRRWDYATWPLGEDILGEAIKRASFVALPNLFQGAPPRTRRLAGACYALQELVGSEFSLSVSQAARVMYELPRDCEPTAAQRSKAHDRLSYFKSGTGKYAGVLVEAKTGRAGRAGLPATRWRLGPAWGHIIEPHTYSSGSSSGSPSPSRR